MPIIRNFSLWCANEQHLRIQRRAGSGDKGSNNLACAAVVDQASHTPGLPIGECINVAYFQWDCGELMARNHREFWMQPALG